MVEHFGLWNTVGECWLCSHDIVFVTDSPVVAEVQRMILESMGCGNSAYDGEWVIRDMEAWLRED